MSKNSVFIKIDSEENIMKVTKCMIESENVRNIVMSSILSYDSLEEKKDNIKMAKILLDSIINLRKQSEKDFKKYLVKAKLIENELVMFLRDSPTSVG